MNTPSMVIQFLLLLWLRSCVGELLPTPNHLWSFNLDGLVKSRSLQKGNAVVASRDGSHIFATASDGSLHIINRHDVSPPITTIFEPSVIASGANSCHSGVVVVDDATENAYLVYAVVSGTASRVFAVNLNGSLRWEVTVEGKIVGTPLVSDKAIYISRNKDYGGYISVLLLTEGVPELTASLAPTEGNAPLGPPTLTTTNGVDAVTVAESWDDGYGKKGNVYMMVEVKGSYEMRLASAWPFSAVTRPIVINSALFMTGAGANIAGWQQKDISNVLAGKKENVDPKWEDQLPVSKADKDQPLLTTPVVSADASLLFVPGANGELYCLDFKNGTPVWFHEDKESSPILSEPIVREDVVYVIESETGMVRQHSVASGDSVWELDCAANDSFCKAAVMADFSISPDENVIYYGDVSGNIVALKIANFDTESPTPKPSEFPSMSPSISPSTSRPSASPSTSFAPTVTGFVPPQTLPPTSAPVLVATTTPTSKSEARIDNLQQNQGGEEDESDNLGVILAVVCAICVILGCISAIIFFGIRRRRVSKKSSSGDSLADKDDKDDYGFDIESPENGTPGSKKASGVAVNTPATMGFESDDDNTTIVLIDQGDGGMSVSTARSLASAFSLVAEVQTNEALLHQMTGDEFSAEEFSDDESGMVVPPPPPIIESGQRQKNEHSHDFVEEKKEGDPPSPTASYSKMYTGDENTMNSGAPAEQRRRSISSASTVSESSLYTGIDVTGMSPSVNSRTSKTPDIASSLPTKEDDLFAKFIHENEEENLPEDEAASSRQKLLQQPKLGHSSVRDDDASAPDDERMMMTPGAHYMSTKTPAQPSPFPSRKQQQQDSLFTPVAFERDSSIDGEGAKFGTASAFEIPAVDPKQHDREEWNNFLGELEQAEKMFAEPNLQPGGLLFDEESVGGDSNVVGYTNQWEDPETQE